MIFRSFLSNQKALTHFMAPQYTILMPGQETKQEKWRDALLTNHFRFLKMDPLFRVDFQLQDTNRAMKMEMIVSGNARALNEVYEAESNLRELLPSMSVNVRNIQGGMARAKERGEYQPHNFPPSAYDATDSNTQFMTQQPLGRQTILQLNLGSADQTHAAVQKTFVDALEKKYTGATVKQTMPMGSALFVVAKHASGTAMLLWDGKTHATVNVWSTLERKKLADSFLKELTKAKWVRELRDDMPRGINRVVNFESDWTANRIEDPDAVDNADGDDAGDTGKEKSAEKGKPEAADEPDDAIKQEL